PTRRARPGPKVALQPSGRRRRTGRVERSGLRAENGPSVLSPQSSALPSAALPKEGADGGDLVDAEEVENRDVGQGSEAGGRAERHQAEQEHRAGKLGIEDGAGQADHQRPDDAPEADADHEDDLSRAEQ